jgi:O-antigen ligase
LEKELTDVLTFLALALAMSAGFLAWRKSVLSIALVIFMNPFDWPVVVGALTVYSNELLLTGLVLGWLGQLAQTRSWKEVSWLELAWAIPFLSAVFLSAVNAVQVSAVIKQCLRYAEMVVLTAYVSNTCLSGKDVYENLRLLLGMGLVVSVIGLIQTVAGPKAGMNLGLEHLTLYDGGVMRAYGTFGHPNQLAGYLILILPAAAIELFYGKTWQARAFPLVCLAVMLAALMATFSRGAWLGLGLAGLGLFVAVVPRAWLWRGLAIGLVVIGLLYAGMKLFPGPGVLVVDRMYSMQHPEQEDSVSFRKVCLQTAGKMFQTHPWLGFGAGEYELNIRKYFNETYYAWSAMDKHIHNLYVQILIESGLFGLIGFLVWLGYGVAVPARRMFKLPPGYARSILAACLAGVLAFLIHNNFDVLTVFARGTHAAVMLGLSLALARTIQNPV